MGDEDDGLSLLGHFPEHLQSFQGLVQAHAGGRLVGDDQLCIGNKCRGHQHPAGHSAGELEGVEVFRLLRQGQPAEEPAAFFRGTRLFPAVHLSSHLHKRV